MPPPDRTRTDRPGLAAALTCFTIWGLLPLLLTAVGRAGAGTAELVAWRVIASIPFAGALVLATGQVPALLAILRRPRILLALVGSSLLIGINWAAYVWAVQHGQTLATSLGYYINPLLNVVFGAWLFRERLSCGAIAALVLATAGVVLEALAIGSAPWIALTLAVAFCSYGVIRKKIPVEAQTGLLAETLILTLPAAAFLVWLHTHGEGAFGRSATATWLLLATGPATVVPLAAFALAARRLPLTVLGFVQFLQPTILFALGVAGGEPVSTLRLAAFGFIWLGVVVFIVDAWRRSRGQVSPSPRTAEG